jgi:hypothetical protein
MGTPRREQTGWAAMRPVLTAFLLAADAFVVISLLALRPGGWLPPFVAFSSLLVGLIWFQLWTIRHRRDDERR